MDYKIIQITPVNTILMAEYQDGEEKIETPIVCLALIEYEDGERTVKLMDICGNGEVTFPDELSNFIGINW